MRRWRIRHGAPRAGEIHNGSDPAIVNGVLQVYLDIDGRETPYLHSEVIDVKKRKKLFKVERAVASQVAKIVWAYDSKEAAAAFEVTPETLSVRVEPIEVWKKVGTWQNNHVPIYRHWTGRAVIVGHRRRMPDGKIRKAYDLHVDGVTAVADTTDVGYLKSYAETALEDQ